MVVEDDQALCFIYKKVLMKLEVEVIQASDGAIAIDMLKTLIATHHQKGVNFILVSHQDIQTLGMNAHATFLVENHTITLVK